MDPHIQPLGDMAIRVEFDDPFGEPKPEVNGRIRAFCSQLAAARITGVVEWVPAFATVAIVYNPLVATYDSLVEDLRDIERLSLVSPAPAGRTVTIPVHYGGEYGPDLAEVAEAKGITKARLIELHSHGIYLVYMLGFTPGFPYLGGLSPELATERRATPRQRVPAGSVGLAGNQTGVYPFASPGGWNIIGRTSSVLYDPLRDPPSLLAPGDIVRFTALEPGALGEQ